MAFHTSQQRRKKSKYGKEAAHHHHLQVDQSHPAKEVQDANIRRTKNVDAIMSLPIYQFRLLQADLHYQLLSILHLAEDFKSLLTKKSFSIVYQVICFLSDKNLKENILKENPVPENIDRVKILNHSLAKVVEGRQETLADMDLETVQSKIREILSPICRLWIITEKQQHRKTQRRNKIKSL